MWNLQLMQYLVSTVRLSPTVKTYRSAVEICTGGDNVPWTLFDATLCPESTVHWCITHTQA